ncbi:hypothetical protein R6Q59_036687 [Mikania micrantha]
MVGYELVFIDIHATKETKKRLRYGEINVNDLDELEFVTLRSKESFKEFHNELVKEYGSNNDQNSDRDELAVWEHLHSNNRGQMFGIGSSDPCFVVTGSQSSCGSISYGDARQSQDVLLFLFFVYTFLSIIEAVLWLKHQSKVTMIFLLFFA